jgi:hypothetical protein
MQMCETESWLRGKGQFSCIGGKDCMGSVKTDPDQCLGLRGRGKYIAECLGGGTTASG